MNIIKKIDNKKVELITGAFIGYGIFVRVQELGYANLQGDEINPLDYLYENNFLYYLFNQKRGPLQYLINFTNTALFGYINEFQIRLPYLFFALAGFYTLYLVTKKIFDKKTALFSTALLSINGLFVAFSRIAQYQSFLFFSLPLTAYLFLKHYEFKYEKGEKKEKNSNPPAGGPNNKLLLCSAGIYAISLLAHYDALSLGAFFPLFLFYKLIRKEINFKKLVTDASIFGAISLIPPAIFYAIMRFNPYYQKVTADYLGRRLSLGGLMPRIPDIMPIITIYIPPHYLLALIIMITFGLLGLIKYAKDIKIWKIHFSEPLVKFGHVLLCLIFGGGTVFARYPIKPRSATLLVCGAAVGITTLLFLSKKMEPKVLALLGWFFLPYCVYFFLIRDPRTHVYTAILPGFIIAGYGLSQLHQKLFCHSELLTLRSLWAKGVDSESNKKAGTRLILKRVQDDASDFLQNISCAGFVLTLISLLTFESGFLWQAFVDKTPEHPWQEKYLLGWKLYDVDHVFHAKPEGVFGVPYYRGWERFGPAIKEDCLRGSFYSNEKDSISYFYSRKHQDEDAEYNADNIISVEGPHSWRFIDEDGRLQPEHLKKEGYVLLKTIKSNHGLPVMWVWGKETLYPEGEPFCDF